MTTIYRGDNTGAFGQDFLRIYLNNPNNLEITKAVVQCNNHMEKVYDYPQFPLRINFSGEETEQLKQQNVIRLAVWDAKGKRRTAEGKFTFLVRENRIHEQDSPIGEDEYIGDGADHSITFDLSDTEFAAQFTINASPSNISELYNDKGYLCIDNIKNGDNINLFVDEDGNLIINADPNIPTDYNNLSNLPKINGIPITGDKTFEDYGVFVQSDWTATSGPAKILNKPKLSVVAITGNFNDLKNLPFIPTKISELDQDITYIQDVDLEKYVTKIDLEKYFENNIIFNDIYEILEQKASKAFVDSELQQKVDTKYFDDILLQYLSKEELEEYIKNILKQYTTQEYVDYVVSDKISKDILGKADLHITLNNKEYIFNANAHVDTYIDIDIPTKISQLENDKDFVTYEDVKLDNFVTTSMLDNATKYKANKSEIGDGVLTLKINNNAVGNFSANTPKSTTINIPIPTKISDLENDEGFITSFDTKSIDVRFENINNSFNNYDKELADIKLEVGKKVNHVEGKTLISLDKIEKLDKLFNYDDTQIKTDIQINKSDIAFLYDNKQDKEEGKGLSTNDFTDEDKAAITNNSNNIKGIILTTTKHTSDIQNLTDEVSIVSSRIESVSDSLQEESKVREQGDIALQGQIDAIIAKSDVTDVVATYVDLVKYPTDTLQVGNIISVMKDETHGDAASYYRFTGTDFEYKGSVGECYTKAESQELFVPQTRTINGIPLDSDITITPDTIGAISNEIKIGDAKIFIKVNDTNLGYFTTNQDTDKEFLINVPTDTAELTNSAQFVDTTELQYEVDLLEDKLKIVNYGIELNAIQIQSNTDDIEMLKSALTGDDSMFPKVALTGDYNDLIHKPVIPTKLSQLENDCDFITRFELMVDYVTKEDMPSKVSQLENDRGFVTTSAIGRGILSVKLNNEFIGSWMANEKYDQTINIPMDNELSTTSTLPVQNNIITSELNLKAYDAEVVHLGRNEEITGYKLFTGDVDLNTAHGITMPIDDNSTNLATTEYVKQQDYSTNTDSVHKFGDETIDDEKKFIGHVILNAADGVTVMNEDNSNKLATTAFVKNQDYSTNAETVHNFGDEIINGNKTFTENTRLDGNNYFSEDSFTETMPSNDNSKHIATTEFVKNQNYSVDTKVVHLNGQEDIFGQKTFKAPTRFDDVIYLNDSTDTEKDECKIIFNTIKTLHLDDNKTLAVNNDHIVLQSELDLLSTEIYNTIDNLDLTINKKIDDINTDLIDLIDTTQEDLLKLIHDNKVDCDTNLDNLKKQHVLDKQELQDDMSALELEMDSRITYVWNHTIRTEGDQIVRGTKTFMDPVIFQDVIFVKALADTGSTGETEYTPVFYVTTEDLIAQNYATKDDVSKVAEVQEFIELNSQGAVMLHENRYHHIIPNGSVRFQLPKIEDDTKYYKMLVQLDMQTTYSMELGTAKFYGEIPDLSKEGLYILFYEYNKGDSSWYCEVKRKSLY